MSSRSAQAIAGPSWVVGICDSSEVGSWQCITRRAAMQQLQIHVRFG